MISHEAAGAHQQGPALARPVGLQPCPRVLLVNLFIVNGCSWYIRVSYHRRAWRRWALKILSVPTGQWLVNDRTEGGCR